MKKVYSSPEIEVVPLRYVHNILESSWLREGDGKVEAKGFYGSWGDGEVEAKGFYGSWEFDDEDE